eukprot:CAMPEP_0170063470 /NCGR_PEP_ID=MMETSP0019_2-20121128/4322_1 /TAXON_ID=98059 /ORGANISM="Dinobryon sp., Strain UTEXLB2267" /LENGTH=352 /DNA_ID=CAMNT_0010269901 /DNA_START=396 /DNA_END=1454 /DNA_ORIENTATION=-
MLSEDSAMPTFLYLDVEYIAPDDPTTKRILGFMTFEFALKLCSSTHIFIDGTFKTCPVPFHEVIIFSTMIETENESRLIPRLYLLLPVKSEHCYSAALNALLENLHNKQHINRETIAWTHASIDCEDGLQEAFLHLDLPNCPNNRITLDGCVFHFAQCLHRKLQSESINLGRIYKNSSNSGLKGFIKKLIALAFLPIDQIKESYQFLVDHEVPASFNKGNEEENNHSTGFQRFQEYFVTFWLENPTNIEKFNCFNRLDYRTNIDMENLNLKFRKLMYDSPHLWTFLRRVTEMDYSMYQDEIQFNSEANAQGRRRMDRRKEIASAKMRARYVAGEINSVEYVRELSQRMIEME